VRIFKRTDGNMESRSFMKIKIDNTECAEGVESELWYQYDCAGTSGTEIRADPIDGGNINFCGIEVYAI
jgi:hypothetical protein